MEKPVVKQAHGLTHEEMEDLKVHQMQDTVPMIPANNAGEDQIKDPYFKDLYEGWVIPTHEKHLYHVATETRLFAQQGDVPTKLSESVVHTFTQEAFRFQMDHKAFAGMVVHILHDPNKPSVEADEDEDDDDAFESNVELSRKTIPQLRDLYLKATGEDLDPGITLKKDILAKVQEAIKNHPKE